MRRRFAGVLRRVSLEFCDAMPDESPAKVSERSVIASGDSKERERRLGRPKATLFLMLTVLWIFPSLGAVWMVGSDARRWFDAAGFIAALEMIRLEQWIGVAILTAHVVFGWLTWHYRRNEPLQEIVMGDEPNPDDEPTKRS